MKKLSIIFGLTLILGLLTTPTFSMSLKFDFHNDPNTWEIEWVLSTIGDTVQVDIWLDVDVPPDPSCYSEISYNFLYDKDLLEVDEVWANDNLLGVGPWDHIFTSIDKIKDGEYYLRVASLLGVSVDDKILLHSLVLRCIGEGEGEIQIQGDVYDCYLDEYAQNVNATIKGPCVITIDPFSPVVFAREEIPFSATGEGDCVEPANYNWELEFSECGSEITPGGLYTAGANCPSYPITNTVKVTDSANENIEATTVVHVNAPIEPFEPTIGAGGRITFKGIIAGCDGPVYTWSVESSIGSTISEGNTVNARGYYRAGRDFETCEEATDTITLKAECFDNDEPPNIIWEGEAITEVTIPPCVVTISPKPAEVESGGTLLLTASKNECCTNDPCYTWTISDGEGNTTNASGPTYTWSESDVGTTVMLADDTTCSNNPPPSSEDTVVVNVITTTTTIVPSPSLCTSDAYCYDGRFCNGIERCVGGKCQSGSDPCPDDGLFCNGDEGCDEGEDVCTQSGDPCAPDLICDEDKDVCVECLDDADCDDNGLFCDGEETCDEENGECVSSGDPCSEPTPICDEDLDRCVGPGPACDISIEPGTAEVVSMQTLSFTAQVTGEDCLDPEYVWSIETTIGSSIDQNGNYVAGINYDFSNETTDVVTVDDNANGISIEATVTVSWGCSLLQIYGEGSKEVKVLRSFRDNVLSQTPEGQEIIRLYYEWSPMIVKAMEDEGFKEVVKEMMDGVLPMIRTE